MTEKYKKVAEKLTRQFSDAGLRDNQLRFKSEQIAEEIISVIFPCFKRQSQPNLEDKLQLLEAELEQLIVLSEQSVKDLAARFIKELPTIQLQLIRDAQALSDFDPAASSLSEVVNAYPGFLAVAFYRIAHDFQLAGAKLIARLISEYAHRLTGIDIHPGANIASGFVIDHGTGVVIGETTEIAENVKIYQGVTLGGLSLSKDMAGKKRHPTIERNVTIYANATILGGETVIGEDSIIGGSVWLTESLPKGSKVYHKADLVVKAGKL